jgi:hypothetical protein
MPATVESFARRQPVTIVEVAQDGRSVVVDCDGERVTFTLRELTGRYVRVGHPYYGDRLRLDPPA